MYARSFLLADTFCLFFAKRLSNSDGLAEPKSEVRKRFTFGGQLNTKQPDILRAALMQLPAASTVIAAMDADREGEDGKS